MDHDSSVVKRLSDRAASHYSTAMAASDSNALRSETMAYATDMHDLMDQMVAQCSDMMTSMSGMNDLSQRMAAAIDDHQTKMQSMTDLAAMKTECYEHHQAMASMLDQMGDMMSSGGMMGGGMM